MFKNQSVIPALSNHKDIETFLKSPLKVGILMNFQLAQLPNLIKKLKQQEKTVLVHLELIKGLNSDEFGAIFLIQSLDVDGIITIKPRVIELCRKRGVLGVFRVFLKDSHSLKQSLDLIQKVQPDVLEVLPATNKTILDKITAITSAKILMGGLIDTKETMDACLKLGITAITTSTVSLWS